MSAPKYLDLMTSFGMNDFMFNQALSSVKEDQATYRLSEKTNTLRGIAAHLLISRHNLGILTDMGFEPLPWNDIGEMFEGGFVESENFPSLGDILSKWQEISPVFMEKLPQVSDEIVNRKSPLDIPDMPEANLGEFIKLNIVHESYHIGQLGLVVKELTGLGIMTPPPEALEA